jgi:hypothetical protein
MFFSISCERYHTDRPQAYFHARLAVEPGAVGDLAKAVEYDPNPRDRRDLVNRRSAGSH